MAGAGYKLFNTGDVLTAAQVNTYLMEQTVMVFADAAARTAALSGVVSEGMISYLKDTNAVEVYNGSAWVASDDPNAIQNTIVDAKGDLITATAADTPARLAVGANNTVLIADSTQATGLKWSGDWAAYTPTVSGITIGNGTLQGRWAQIGKTTFVEVYFKFGSTSAVTGLPVFSIPVSAKLSSYTLNGTGSFGDAGVGTYLAFLNLQDANNFFLAAIGSNTTYISEVVPSATVPFTWTTNDYMSGRLTYEAI